MAYTVEISDNTADNLVVDILKNNLRYLRADIERVSSKGTLLDFEKEDLENFRVLEQQFVGVIRYYTTPDKWDAI
jgi:hypothetical protein